MISTTQNHSTFEKPSVNPPLHPGWIFPAALLAGLTVSGPVAGSILIKTGRRWWGWVLGSSTALLGLLLLVLSVYWKTEWYWISISLTVLHLLGAIGLYVLVLKPYDSFCVSQPSRLPERGSYRQVIAGLVGGAFIGLLFGTFITIFYLLLADYFFSTLAPMNFEDVSTLLKGGLILFFLTLSGLAAGGIMGRFKPSLSVTRLIFYGIVLMWTNLTWLMAVEALLSIPAFQAASASGPHWTFFFMPFLVGYGGSILLLFFVIQPQSRGPKIKRFFLVIFINLAAVFMLSVTLGRQTDMLLAAGRSLERSAYTREALWCYEQALSKKPDEQVASYLQYRVALLNHKLGREEQALQGFRRVVAKYTGNQDLVKKSNRFFDNLERNRGQRRVVLSGVETRTEYKGGYCVPNSLALVMRYWGSNVTARTIGRQITRLGSGTYSIDQKWFAEQQNFRHEFLPLATPEDIKVCIDAGFPVLVYVPAHAFVIMGYDEALETYVTYDVATEDIWSEYLQKDFVRAWKKEGATLILAYPPDKENRLPAALHDRLLRLSPLYFHFQLYAFSQALDPEAVAHLRQALDDKGEYFLPATVLYTRFPWLDPSALNRVPTRALQASLKNYFWNDFDESTDFDNAADSEEEALPDRTLQYGLQYLVRQREFGLMEELITHIAAEGRVSSRTLSELGMVDLARGNISKGLERLQRAEDYENAFYLGLIHLGSGRAQAAVRELAQAAKNQARFLAETENEESDSVYEPSPDNDHFFDEKRSLALDDYGFPQTALTNALLARQADLGESKAELEKVWEQWSHYLPFDTEVNKALIKILQARLAAMDRKKDPGLFHEIEIKIGLLKGRVARYDIASPSYRK